MEDIKDEIIEELWQIKDNLSSSCKGDMGELVKIMNRIAEEYDLTGTLQNEYQGIQAKAS